MERLWHKKIGTFLSGYMIERRKKAHFLGWATR